MTGNITDLNADECFELLEGHSVGRVALSTQAGIRIVPVNYRLHEDQVVFRTAPYSELGTYGDGSEVAFEVDRLDEEREEGWSVVLTGRLHLIEDPDEVLDIRRTADPSPWAVGSRSLYMRLVWTGVSGRRIDAMPS